MLLHSFWWLPCILWFTFRHYHFLFLLKSFRPQPTQFPSHMQDTLKIPFPISTEKIYSFLICTYFYHFKKPPLFVYRLASQYIFQTCNCAMSLLFSYLFTYLFYVVVSDQWAFWLWAQWFIYCIPEDSQSASYIEGVP
jgi:hypothetical protein